MGPKRMPPDYLREIERVFVSRRGGVPFLSPADWEVASRWEANGIPLAVVVEGIARAFGVGGIGPRSGLGSCSAAVEAVWSERRRSQIGGGKVRSSPAELLRNWDPPPDLPVEIREPIGRLVEEASLRLADPASSRSALLHLAGACFEALPEECRRVLSEKARRSLEGYRSRMPDPAFRKLVRESAHRLAARLLRLPLP